MLEHIDPSNFEALYKLIRHAEQTLNGFMSYVRRQRAGAQEYGTKKIGENEPGYEVAVFPADK